MDLTIKSIGARELSLIKKTYKDAPSVSEEHKKSVTTRAAKGSDENIKYDANLFRISRANAVAYKEFNVTKINKRGKRQTRVLGIDRLSIHNMTVKQAQKKKQYSPTGGKGKKISNHIGFWFRKNTMNPEIPTTAIARAIQDEKKLNIIYIDLKQQYAMETNEAVRKTYVSETSDQAVEIVGKLNMILSINAEESGSRT